MSKRLAVPALTRENAKLIHNEDSEIAANDGDPAMPTTSASRVEAEASSGLSSRSQGDAIPASSDDILGDLPFVRADGEEMIVLKNLVRRILGRRPEWKMQMLARRLGQAWENERGFRFDSFAGTRRGQEIAATSEGVQTFVRQLDQERIDEARDLLVAVVRRLDASAELDLVSAHRRVTLAGSGAASGEVVFTKRGTTPYLVVASLLNRFGVLNTNYATVMYGRSGSAGILRYLLKCAVELPDDVEQKMSSGPSSEGPDYQSVEHCSTDGAEYFAEEAEDYEKVIGARSQGIKWASTLWDKGRETLCADFPAVVLIINRLRTPAARNFRLGMLEMGLLMTSGDERVAQSFARYWQEVRRRKPDDDLLNFMGAVVEQSVPANGAASNEGPADASANLERAREQDTLEEIEHNRFKRQLERDALLESANSERQGRADCLHEKNKQAKVDTLLKAREFFAPGSEEAKRFERRATDTVYTIAFGSSRPDAVKGQPLRATQFLEEETRCTEEQAHRLCPHFGKVASACMQKDHPDYDLDINKSKVTYKGCSRDVNQYYECHRETLRRALREFLKTRAGLELVPVERRTTISRFFAPARD